MGTQFRAFRLSERPLLSRRARLLTTASEQTSLKSFSHKCENSIATLLLLFPKKSVGLFGSPLSGGILRLTPSPRALLQRARQIHCRSFTVNPGSFAGRKTKCHAGLTHNDMSIPCRDFAKTYPR